MLNRINFIMYTTKFDTFSFDQMKKIYNVF